MRKYIIIILIIILMLTVSCSNNKNLPYEIEIINSDTNETNNNGLDSSDENLGTKNDDKDSSIDSNDDVDIEEDNLKEANLGISVKDDNYIYYVPIPYDNLYCIKKDGSEKKLIHEQERIFNIEIYNNRLYIYSSIYTNTIPPREVIPSKIETMNKDGTDVKKLDFGLNFTTLYHLSGFWIYRDFLFFTVSDYLNDIDSMYTPNDLYKYDLKSGNVTLIHSGIDGVDRPITYGDYCYYFINNEGVYSLYKYNIFSEEKTSIIINKNKDLAYISYDFIVDDSNIYYHTKTYINKDELDGLTDSKTIFENDDFMIISITVSDEFIFFINMEETSQENIGDYKMDLTIRRINHDGSKLKTLYKETMPGINLPPGIVEVTLEGNNLVYRNKITATYKVMDFEGNIIE